MPSSWRSASDRIRRVSRSTSFSANNGPNRSSPSRASNASSGSLITRRPLRSPRARSNHPASSTAVAAGIVSAQASTRSPIAACPSSGASSGTTGMPATYATAPSTPGCSNAGASCTLSPTTCETSTNRVNGDRRTIAAGQWRSWAGVERAGRSDRRGAVGPERRRAHRRDGGVRLTRPLGVVLGGAGELLAVMVEGERCLGGTRQCGMDHDRSSECRLDCPLYTGRREWIERQRRVSDGEPVGPADLARQGGRGVAGGDTARQPVRWTQ